MTEGGHASAVFYPDGEYEQEVPGIGTLTDGVSSIGVLAHVCRARRPLIPVSSRRCQTMTLAIESLPGETPLLLWITAMRAPLREPFVRVFVRRKVGVWNIRRPK